MDRYTCAIHHTCVDALCANTLRCTSPHPPTHTHQRSHQHSTARKPRLKLHDAYHWAYSMCVHAHACVRACVYTHAPCLRIHIAHPSELRSINDPKSGIGTTRLKTRSHVNNAGREHEQKSVDNFCPLRPILAPPVTRHFRSYLYLSPPPMKKKTKKRKRDTKKRIKQRQLKNQNG